MYKKKVGELRWQATMWFGQTLLEIGQNLWKFQKFWVLLKVI